MSEEVIEEKPAPREFKLTDEQRAEILELVGEGIMSVSACAAHFGVSVTYVSKYVQKNGVSFRCRPAEREKAAEEAKAAKLAVIHATFAERRAEAAESHKRSALQALQLGFGLHTRMLQKSLQAAKDGTEDPLSVKEHNVVARTLAIYNDSLRILLSIDEMVSSDELPELRIVDLSDDELVALRESAGVEADPLTSLDDDIVTEEGE